MIKKFAVSFWVLILLLGCSSQQKIIKSVYPVLSDGKYDSEFPYRNCSAELNKITKTVKKIYCTAYYKHHVFTKEMQITRLDIVTSTLLTAKEISFNNHTVSGTGTIVYAKDKHVGILSCAHIFDKPDTIVTYFDNGFEQKYVQSVAIKQRQKNYIPDIEGCDDLTIYAYDREKDIALLGAKLGVTPQKSIAVFDYPFGKAKRLEWGSFVYLVGYPKGYKIVTKGIVSQPNRDKNNAFIIDALFNTGFSGGIVLAIMDGAPNFELVGMATLVSADHEYVLAPKQNGDYDENLPYEGFVYPKYQTNINYGICQAISAEAIINLLEENKNHLKKNGFDFDYLWEREGATN